MGWEDAIQPGRLMPAKPDPRRKHLQALRSTMPRLKPVAEYALDLSRSQSESQSHGCGRVSAMRINHRDGRRRLTTRSQLTPSPRSKTHLMVHPGTRPRTRDEPALILDHPPRPDVAVSSGPRSCSVPPVLAAR